MSAASVMDSTASFQEESPGSSPRAALQQIWVSMIAHSLAKAVIERNHYLRSLPGGTQICFGVSVGVRLMGVLTLGCGPSQAYRLVEGANRDDCVTLTRLWLSDDLPRNSESRVIGIVLRALKKHTSIRFVLSYADPSHGHVGTIYQATGWTYTGLSEATPLYDIGDGVPRHSRSLSHAYGTHSLKHFATHGVQVKLVHQTPKHQYLYFLDTEWRERLKTEALPYPRKE